MPHGLILIHVLKIIVDYFTQPALISDRISSFPGGTLFENI